MRVVSVILFWCWTRLKDKAIADRLSQKSTGTLGSEMCRNVNNCLIQSNSTEINDKAWYSTSVDYLKTVCCFLKDHKIGLLPKKTTKPVVDLLSLGSPAQLASLKAFNYKSPLVYDIPNCMVPFRYCNICLTAVKWDTMRFCIKWQTWCTEKAISGLVKVKYCRAPTMLRYNLVFE